MHTDPTSRLDRGEEDLRAIRDLLPSTQSITPNGFPWEMRRWDGSP